jgi:tRNA(Ile)-lysidine synthase
MAMEQGASVVLLAQHRRDQAETFVLQALRGAGPAGLAGMPVSVLREGIVWARPWLGRPHEDIKAYAVRHRLKFIDDESNDDPRFARNRLRLRLWPVLTDAFPQAEAALADSAQWAQEAVACLTELAQQDMPSLQLASESLDVRAWLALSAARRSNVLRAWLKLRLGSAASASLVARLMHELRPVGSAHWPLENGELRLYRGVLSHRMQLKAHSLPLAECETTLAVHRIGKFPLPGWGGCLQVERVKEGGVHLAWLGQLELKTRQGAEQFQMSLARPPRSLKKQYQAAGVPAWDRGGPLFYSGGQLVFVPGLGIDARVLALTGQPQVSLRWSSAGATELK